MKNIYHEKNSKNTPVAKKYISEERKLLKTKRDIYNNKRVNSPRSYNDVKYFSPDQESFKIHERKTNGTKRKNKQMQLYLEMLTLLSL